MDQTNNNLILNTILNIELTMFSINNIYKINLYAKYSKDIFIKEYFYKISFVLYLCYFKDISLFASKKNSEK